MPRSWPMSLVISFSCLSLLLGGLLFWMHKVQGQYHKQEEETYRKRMEGLEASGQSLVDQQEQLLKEQARDALISGEPSRLLLGWADSKNREIVVFAPQPDFSSFLSSQEPAPKKTRWRTLLNSPDLYPSGLPKRLVATVELVGSGVILTSEEKQIWRRNMTALWNNSDRLDLLKLHTLLVALPDAQRPVFFIQLLLIREILDLSDGEGVYVTYGARTGLMRFSAAQWASAGSGFNKMGLVMDASSFLKSPVLEFIGDDVDLDNKQARERLFLGAGSLLLLIALAVMGFAISMLLKTYRSRQMLLHAVSHEFRTPLSAVIQFSEMLLDKRYASTEKAEVYMRQIHRESCRLQGLLENVLTLARIEKRLFVVQPEAQDVSVFLKEFKRQAVLSNPELAEQLRLEFQHPSIQALFDESALLKTIRNLLENALKYGEPPYALRSECLENKWVLHIVDHGPGLPQEVQRHLFKPYTRKKRDQSEGMGLGLHLVKSIIDAHHGAIEFRGGKSEGLDAVITLPLAEDNGTPLKSR